MISETRKALEVENATLRARLSEAEEALRPFAKAYGLAGDGIPDETPVDDHVPEEYRCGVTWGDVRLARRTLERLEADDG